MDPLIALADLRPSPNPLFPTPNRQRKDPVGITNETPHAIPKIQNNFYIRVPAESATRLLTGNPQLRDFMGLSVKPNTEPL